MTSNDQSSIREIIYKKDFKRLPSGLSLSADGSHTSLIVPNHEVMMLDPYGKVLWKGNVEGNVSHVYTTADASITVVSTTRGLFYFDKQGKEIRSIKEPVSRAIVEANGRFTFFCISDSVKVSSSISLHDSLKKGFLQRKPGAVVWKAKFDELIQFIGASRDCSAVVAGFSRRVLSLDSNQNVRFDLKVSSTIKGLAVNSDASHIVFSTADGRVTSLHGDGSARFVADLGEDIGPLDISADGRLTIAPARSKPAILLLDNAGNVLWRFVVPRPMNVRISDEGSVFVVCCADGQFLACGNYYLDADSRIEHAH